MARTEFVLETIYDRSKATKNKIFLFLCCEGSCTYKYVIWIAIIGPFATVIHMFVNTGILASALLKYIVLDTCVCVRVCVS